MHYITSHHIIYASATHTRARAQAVSSCNQKDFLCYYILLWNWKTEHREKLTKNTVS